MFVWLSFLDYFNLTSPVDRIMYVSLGSNFTIVSKYVCQGQGCNTIDVIWYFKSTNGTLKSIEIDENERISIIDQSSLFVEDASFDDNGTFICDLEGPGFLSFSATIIIKGKASKFTGNKPVATELCYNGPELGKTVSVCDAWAVGEVERDTIFRVECSKRVSDKSKRYNRSRVPVGTRRRFDVEFRLK